MIPVYQAANATDAYLIKNLLEQAGIPSYIRGEHLQGALGDLPVSGLMHVCVAEQDAKRAREIVLGWEQSDPEEFDEVEAASMQPPDEPVLKRRWIGTLIAFALGAALGGGLVWAALRTPFTENGIDYNGDGKLDERVFYAGNMFERIELDRNNDSKVDAISYYGRDGVISRGESDDDFDGRMESRFEYLHGQWLTQETDEDGDGDVDYTAAAISGVIYSEEWLDAAGKVIKRVVFKDARPITADLDTNKDGVLDTRQFFDAIGEIERTESLATAE